MSSSSSGAPSAPLSTSSSSSSSSAPAPNASSAAAAASSGSAAAAATAAAAAAAASAASSSKPLFDKILIANRGEISCRVSRTAHRMGIKTVAIHSDPDYRAVHVAAADEAVCVGPAASAKSYLNVPRILDAIRSSGAQAVHPGYGFLSENAGFARVLEERGIKFIGPPSGAIDAMGDKIESKQLAIKAGVNTIPGFLGIVADDNEAVRIAREIGFPVMIKASAGGGGKGMRIAWNDAEVRLGFRLSKDEAKSSFGDDRLFVEKFIEDPRHIEIQLIADSHGNVAALPERECSIQRRNQKVIEESPSVLLDEKTRRAMQNQACMLASAVGYQSAGTVEFLADKHRNFYFLEMNTRLQVEHPVTEMVTGLDLVELMIRVAAGEKLPAHLRGGAHVPILGHAFESRVYAEDPFRGFLPSTGRLSKYEEPQAAAARDPYLADSGAIRTDAGVTEGSEISMHYDPMICKLVTHGPTRDDALDRMRAALDAYVIRGVGHNVPFLRALIDHERFRAGRLTTQFIREEFPDGFQGVALAPESRTQLAAVAAVMQHAREALAADSSGRLRSAAAPAALDFVVTLAASYNAGRSAAGAGAGASTYAVSLQQLYPYSGDEDGDDFEEGEHGAAATGVAGVGAGGGQAVEAGHEHCDHGPGGHHHHHHDDHGEEGEDDYDDGRPEWVCEVTPLAASGAPLAGAEPALVRLGSVDWAVDAPLFLARLAEGPQPAQQAGWRSAATLRVQHMARLPSGFRLQFQGATEDATVRTARAHALAQFMLPKAARDTSKFVSSPMPGTLVSLAVKAGQLVEDGQELCVVEAMKMQNVIRSARKGRVKSVSVKPGQSLQVDEVLIEYEDDKKAA